MGAIKQLLIEEQESENTGNSRVGRVPNNGGDEMSQDFISQLDALIAQADGAEEVKETPEETPEETVSGGDALGLIETQGQG